MKCVPVVFLVLAAVLFHEGYADEYCFPENCISPSNCAMLSKGGKCPIPGTMCCSVVKKGSETHCRHYGGECMDWCGVSLQRNAVDCPAYSKCCVLV